MSYDFADFQETDLQSRPGDEVNTHSPSNTARQAAGRTNSKNARTRAWAWSQGTESYDWMDSHSPFPMSDLSD